MADTDTLPIADEGSEVVYMEGCTAPYNNGERARG